MARLDFPTSKLADDLPVPLKLLRHPFKFNKSLLKATAAPHHWPTFLAFAHWLVKIAMDNDHLASSANSTSLTENNVLYWYTLDSYLHYMRGDDDAVYELDQECREKLERGKHIVEEENLKATENVARLEAELEGLRSSASQKEVLEKKSLLEDDVTKSHRMIKNLSSKIKEKEKVLGLKERQLDAKVQHNKRHCVENE